MTHGGRLARWITALLLAIGLAAVTSPAHASGSSSPHRAVDRFLHLSETGHGAQAYLEVQPSCRTPKGRQQLDELSHHLADLHTHFHTVGYHETVSHGKAEVSYKLYADVKGKTRQIGAVHGADWVRLGSSWYLACHQA